MSKQIIDAIRAAEAEAAKKKSDAAEKARIYAVSSKDAARSEYESVVASARNDMEDKLAMIESQAAALISKNKTEAEADAAKETEAAMQHMDAAVEIIIGELIKHVGK